MEVENFNNNLFCLVMINSYFKAGKLVKEASSEVKMCRRDIKVTEVLIDKRIVGSAPALSWIRKGQTKDILRYVSVIFEVTNYLPLHRRDHYRLAMFDVVARVAMGHRDRYVDSLFH